MCCCQEREEEIHCSPAVTHKDINRYCNYCPHGCRNCKSVMERARTTVTDAKESYRKNFEITCVGDHISLRFWSGSRRNKLRVQMGDDEKADVKTIRELTCGECVLGCLKYFFISIYHCFRWCFFRMYDCCKSCYECCRKKEGEDEWLLPKNS